ncbi:MAG TPA: flagellar biosynthetic protein FliR [Rhizomicrobium sp.]|jgi:flagellar biosynthetic protein FliR|nr:flagellar biosynthetic protein FliR [Rhizomicrobium sp.]
MTFQLPNLPVTILVYALVFSRVGAMVMLLPSIGDASVPPRVRLTLALAIAFALTPALAQYYPATIPNDFIGLGVLLTRETICGLAIGGAARIVMAALQVGGNLIATQTGLAYAQTIDPTQNQAGALVGNFFSLLGATLIFATDLHHLAIEAIQGSYRMLPPTGDLPTSDMAELALRLVSGTFLLGVELAAPFLVFGFVVTAAIGLLARLMPQFQVFFIVTPINIMVGFLLIMLLLGTLMTVFLNYYTAQMTAFL